MGGSSSAGSTSTSTKGFKATSQTNPFFTTKTDKNGNTTTNFQNGTAGQTVYDTTNNYLQSLLDSYIKGGSTDDPYFTAARKLHDDEMRMDMENNVLNPLLQNNMIRSSQATNMYNNLAQKSSDYANQLMLDWDNRQAEKIKNLWSMYTGSYTGASGDQQASINASLGGGTTKTKSNSKAG